MSARDDHGHTSLPPARVVSLYGLRLSRPMGVGELLWALVPVVALMVMVFAGSVQVAVWLVPDPSIWRLPLVIVLNLVALQGVRSAVETFVGPVEVAREEDE